jgi:hypothetical protein
MGIMLLLLIILWAITAIIHIPAIISAVIFDTSEIISQSITGTITVHLSKLPISILIWANMGALLANIIGVPIYIIGKTLLYFDLRVRKQGYNLEKLAGELGLPYTAPDPSSPPP